MGPLLNTISLEVPGSLGEPALVCSVSGNGMSALGVGEWGGLERRLSGLLSVRAWFLAPRGQRAAFSSLFWGPLPVWERKQKDPWQEMVFFL